MYLSSWILRRETVSNSQDMELEMLITEGKGPSQTLYIWSMCIVCIHVKCDICVYKITLWNQWHCHQVRGSWWKWNWSKPWWRNVPHQVLPPQHSLRSAATGMSVMLEDIPISDPLDARNSSTPWVKCWMPKERQLWPWWRLISAAWDAKSRQCRMNESRVVMAIAWQPAPLSSKQSAKDKIVT